MCRRAFALVVLGLAACGTTPEERIERVEPRFAQDAALLLRAWDDADVVAMVQQIDRAHTLVDRAAAMRHLAVLRTRLGRVTQSGRGLVDPATGDARVFAVGHHVVATEHGVAWLRVAYDRDLAIVDFDVDGELAGQH